MKFNEYYNVIQCDYIDLFIFNPSFLRLLDSSSLSFYYLPTPSFSLFFFFNIRHIAFLKFIGVYQTLYYDITFLLCIFDYYAKHASLRNFLPNVTYVSTYVRFFFATYTIGFHVRRINKTRTFHSRSPKIVDFYFCFVCFVLFQ